MGEHFERHLVTALLVFLVIFWAASSAFTPTAPKQDKCIAEGTGWTTPMDGTLPQPVRVRMEIPCANASADGGTDAAGD